MRRFFFVFSVTSSVIPSVIPIFTLFLFIAIVSGSFAVAWDGPAQAPGATLGRLFKPTNFVDVSGSGTWGDDSYTDSRFRLNLIASQSETDTWQLNAHAQRFHFDEDLPLPSGPGPDAPRDLYQVGVGMSYSHKVDKGDWGLIVGLGSDSDIPFNSIHEDTIQLTGTYTRSVDSLHTWIFFLSYSNNRAFAANIPLPGASYLVIDPTDHLVVSYGLPFFVSWTPLTDLNFKLVYFIPTAIGAEISYRLNKTFKAHMNYDWFSQAWLPANRLAYTDQLILDQMRASAGMRASPGDDWYIDVFGGYAFDQRLFEAQSLFSSGITKTYLTAGPFLQAEVSYKF